MTGKPLILIVDDDPLARQMLVTSLREQLGAGYEYEKAAGAEEAEELILEAVSQGAAPGLIISDWMMPGKRGDQFLKEMHKLYPDVPLVLYSGVADDVVEQAIRYDSKIICRLPKPWDGVACLDKLQTALGA